MSSVKESFDKVYVPDLTNTPMTPDGVGGGMPTRWTYSEYGRFLSVYGIRNQVHVVFNLASAEDIKQKLDALYKMRDRGLVDNIDLQELEERLRIMSNISIYGNGSKDQSMAAISESEASDEIKEGKSLSSKYDYAITVFNKAKMQKKGFKPWSILSFEDRGDRDNKGEPWVKGAFGNAVITVKSGRNGAEGLYLATKNDVNSLRNMRSEEDVLDYIKNKCKEVNVKNVDYSKIFDVKVDEAYIRYGNSPDYSIKQLKKWLSSKLISKGVYVDVMRCINIISKDPNFDGKCATRFGNDRLELVFNYPSGLGNERDKLVDKCYRVSKETSLYIDDEEDYIRIVILAGDGIDEAVKPTTTQAQLDHIRKIQPLSHTNEANAKRRKTIEAKKEARMLGLDK